MKYIVLANLLFLFVTLFTIQSHDGYCLSKINLARDKSWKETNKITHEARQANSQQNGKINVKEAGLKGDGVHDDTKALQQIINTNDGAHLYFPAGTYIISGINLKSGTTLEGESKESSILKASKSPDDSLLRGNELENITITKLSIINDSKTPVVLILFTGETKQMNAIKIIDCVIKNKYAPADCIVFSKYMKNMVVENNYIEAMENPPLRRDHTQISCVRLRGEHTYSDRKSPVHIRGNTMINGNCGIRISGKGNPPAPLYVEKNIITGQLGSGALFYHSTYCFVTENSFKGITAVSMKNNDGGVVWLDKYRDGKTIFRKNIISDCIGNGIYVEELRGSIIDSNVIKNMKKRKNDTFRAKIRNVEYTSNGGHGILLTGGSRDLMIRNNKIFNNEGSGIHLDRGIGVQQIAKIDSINIMDNEIDMNENGVLIMGKVEKVKIIHNKFKNNGSNATGNSSNAANSTQSGAKENSAAVKVKRNDPQDHLRELTFSDNEVDGNESGNKQYNAINKTYSDQESKVIMNNNYINTGGGEAVDWPQGKKTIGKNTFKKNGKASTN